jgi:hypothetical protein
MESSSEGLQYLQPALDLDLDLRLGYAGMVVLEDLELILEVLLLRGLMRETAPEGRWYLDLAVAVVLRPRSTRKTASEDSECLNSAAVAALKRRLARKTASEDLQDLQDLRSSVSR